MAKLRIKQRKFVDEYLVDLNAYQAAIRAGYSENFAKVHSSRMLEDVRIKDLLQKRMNDREKRTEITQDRVLKEIANIAFSDGTSFAKLTTKNVKEPMVNEDNEVIMVNGEPFMQEIQRQEVEFVDTDALPEEKKSAIAAISKTKNGVEVKSYDKLKALELLGKHLGMFTDKVEISGSIAFEKNDEQKKAMILKMANKIGEEAK